MRTAENGLQSKPLILTAVIVATLCCSAGIAAAIGYGVLPGAAPGDRAGLLAFVPWRGSVARSAIEPRGDMHPEMAIERPTARCSRCGVVESIRAIGIGDGVRAEGYELTIRFRDGVRRTIKLASHGQWQLGDRILVIDSET